MKISDSERCESLATISLYSEKVRTFRRRVGTFIDIFHPVKSATMPQRPRYGQVVVGPCGSGKTTYCDGMQQYLKLLGRDAVVINLDPANEGAPTTEGADGDESSALPYKAIYDVCTEAVNLSAVMAELRLGPNGGLVYCMEYLEEHADEIIQQIQERISPGSYLILDLPGQVELYTHSTCVQKLLHKLANALDLRLTAVQLMDALYCTDVTKFIAAAVLGTTTLLRLELPTVSVLSKVDLLNTYGELPLQLDYFAECHDLDRLLPFLHQSSSSDELPRASKSKDGADEQDEFDFADDPEYQKARRKRRESKLAVKHEKLHRALAEIVDDYGLLTFVPLEISSAASVGRVLAKIDKCNGYVFTEASVNEDMFKCAIQSEDASSYYEAVSDVRERIASPESIQELQNDEIERRE